MALYKTDISITIFSKEKLNIDGENLVCRGIGDTSSVIEFTYNKEYIRLDAELEDCRSTTPIRIGNVYWLEEESRLWVVTGIDKNDTEYHNLYHEPYYIKLIFGKSSSKIQYSSSDDIERILDSLSSDNVTIKDNSIIFISSKNDTNSLDLTIDINSIKNNNYSLTNKTVYDLHGLLKFENDMISNIDYSLKKRFLFRLSDHQIIDLMRMLDADIRDVEK